MRYLLSLSFIGLLSCGGMKKQAGDQTAQLAGSSWEMQKIMDFDAEPTAKKVTLYFSDTSARFGGNGGCNGYGGEYKVDGNKLTMEKIISTQMACMPGSKTETKFFSVLQTTDNYKISGKKLQLLQGDKLLAECVAAKKD